MVRVEREAEGGVGFGGWASGRFGLVGGIVVVGLEGMRFEVLLV